VVKKKASLKEVCSEKKAKIPCEWLAERKGLEGHGRVSYLEIRIIRERRTPEKVP